MKKSSSPSSSRKRSASRKKRSSSSSSSSSSSTRKKRQRVVSLICRKLKQPIYEQTEIEDDLIDHGFKNITPIKKEEEEEGDESNESNEGLYDGLYERLVSMVHRAKRGADTFCMKDGAGISMDMLTHYTTGHDTVLFSLRCAIKDLKSVDDIRAVLAFDYHDVENRVVLIDSFCSNQLTKAGGGKLLLSPLVSACKRNEVEMITVIPTPSALSYYSHMGFKEPDENSDINYLVLGGA